MKQTIGAFLKLIETYCDAANEQQEVVAFCADKKEQYILEVEKRCAEYKEKYMDAEVKYLDRHKIAAILVVVGLKVGIVKNVHENSDTSEILFVGPHKILLMGALEYLRAMINKALEGTSLASIKEYFLPSAWACSTEYLDIMSRNLYFAQTDFVLNDMELAEKFFLIEYITVWQLYNKSDVEKCFTILKEYDGVSY